MVAWVATTDSWWLVPTAVKGKRTNAGSPALAPPNGPSTKQVASTLGVVMPEKSEG